MKRDRPFTPEEKREIGRKIADLLNGKPVPGARLVHKEEIETMKIVLNFLNDSKGKSSPYIRGGVVVTPEIFQQGIDSVGKNIELSVRKGTALESMLATVAVTCEKPVVTIKLANHDGCKCFAGGELGWEGDSQIITERGVFDVFEGKLYCYLFEIDVREKMVTLFREYAATLK